jgi:CrcB protein
LKQLLSIALGGSLGALARHGVAAFAVGQKEGIFPTGTLVINLSGSFIIGALAELFEATVVPAHIRAFITIGFLGAYTTFSTYSLETMNLLRDGEIRLALVNVLISNVLALLLVAAGMYGARLLLKTSV